jgi:hypothetical protein
MSDFIFLSLVLTLSGYTVFFELFKNPFLIAGTGLPMMMMVMFT